jgi:hypothetical protein
MSYSFLPMSTILPLPVREALVAASRIDSRIDFGEHDTRPAAVDAVAAEARRTHPQFFRE